MREAAPPHNLFLHEFGHDMLYGLALVPEAIIRSFRRTVQRIRNKLGEFNGDYEVTAAKETHPRKGLPNSLVRSRPCLTTISQSQ